MSVPSLRRRLVAPVALLFLAACGVGSPPELDLSDLDPPDEETQVTGKVLAVDGRSTPLGGLRIAIVETGRAVTTASDGGFSLGSVPADGATLAVVSGSGSAICESHRATLEGEQPEGRVGIALCHGLAHVWGFGIGGEVALEVRVVDGAIVEIRTDSAEHDSREVEIEMRQTGRNHASGMSARLEVAQHEGQTHLGVWIDGATPGTVWELVLVSSDGRTHPLGGLGADDTGRARWTVDAADLHGLPIEMGSARNSESPYVEIRHPQTGRVMFVASLPDLHAEPKE